MQSKVYSPCSIRKAGTWFTVVIIITLGTHRTVFRSSELWLALTHSTVCCTVASVPVIRAVTGDAGVGVVREHARTTVETIDTALTVDTSSVSLALLAYPTPLIVPVDIHGHLHVVNSLVEVAFIRVAIAVTRLAFKSVISCVASPLLLGETIHTLVTVQTSGLVLALTL